MPIDDWEPRDDWSSRENNMWADMATENFADDPWAQYLYDQSFFTFGETPEETNRFRDAFEQYLDTYYGIDLDEVFDWEAWREAYGEAT